ncbi:hypothetical protein HRG_007051 [Hirsutella rhossiliensis]|uniref:Uncharacterized protein n=1 Tax=Hirsutella rhossiliensis TaxID=111463 RepID=A0A9P8SIF8_9HYPO|nr:uncharacterized protein HRG_07051 [Hirsutella rhossiliensis]KAH0961971.1 hypothetical protein HRG_07051 [Hirsutella rhossiliensis]
METSSFDPCLLITANNIADKDLFGIAALQTDDTFIAKPKEILQEGSICDFNGSRLTIQNGCVIVRQKGQAQNLEEINLQASTQEPVNTDFKALNKRIEWQINNPDRGLCYIPIDLEREDLCVHRWIIRQQ